MQSVGNMAALGDQTLMTAFDNLSLAVANDTLTAPALATSGASVTSGATVAYKLFGLWYSKAATVAAFTVGTASNIAIGYEQCFMYQFDLSGNALLIPGSPSFGPGTALWPERPIPTITSTTAASAAGTVTVPVASVGNFQVGQVVTVDVGLNAENVTLTAVTPISNSSSVASITGVFANAHPAGALIRQAFCPIGGVRIYNNSGSAFTAGTTTLGTAGLTVTYYNGYPFPLFQSAQ